MTKIPNQQIIDETFRAIFEESPFNFNQVLEKFAFDVKLPQEVYDSTTGEKTWATSINPTKFITQKNSYKKADDWLQNKITPSSLAQLLSLWERINYTTTERVYDSENVFESDTIYSSHNVWRSSDCNECQNIVFCDSCFGSDHLIASSRSGNCNYCLRVDDSNGCSNSYNVICSSKIANSLFVQDCGNLSDCIFCSHISNRQYCIANMQFEPEEYYQYKKQIIRWILDSTS